MPSPLTVEEVLRNPGLLDQLSLPAQTCPHCGIAIHETITGKRMTPQGYACSDCYYEALGQEIEKHPVLTGGIRRV